MIKKIFCLGVDVLTIVPACIGYYFIVIRPTQQMQPLYDSEDTARSTKKPNTPSSQFP